VADTTAAVAWVVVETMAVACHAAAAAETAAVTMDRAAVVVTDAVKENNFALECGTAGSGICRPLFIFELPEENLVMVEERPFMAVK
jgi:hypothetical protein